MSSELNSLINKIQSGDWRALSRAMTLVENDAAGKKFILENISVRSKVPVIGITGAPGAGKSSLVNALLKQFTAEKKKIAVLAVDPSSPFTKGAILGDRLRLSNHFTNENIFIRSLATRGSLGGLCAAAIEITDLLRSAPFDYIVIETVGVGQSEVEIVGIAAATVVVVVPESGDEIQAMKSGLMETGDFFVVNKSDRADADRAVSALHAMMHTHHGESWFPPVIKTIATTGEGVDELRKQIEIFLALKSNPERKNYFLGEKAWQLIAKKKMENISAEKLAEEIAIASQKPDFNFYRFILEKAKAN